MFKIKFGKRGKETDVGGLLSLSQSGTAVERNKLCIILDYIFASKNCEDKRPYLLISILGFEVNALLDSGCTRTVMSRDLFAYLKGRFKVNMESFSVSFC